MRQGAHGAGEDNHGGGGVAAAGDVGSDVRIRRGGGAWDRGRRGVFRGGSGGR